MNRKKESMSFDSFYDARDNLILDILQKDFIGPVEEGEVLSEFPIQYYIMGKIYPLDSDGEQILNTSANTFVESEDNDPSLSLSNMRNPSSMGITFTLKPEVSKYFIKASYALYDNIPFQQAADTGIDLTSWTSEEKCGTQPKHFWRRRPEEFFCEIDNGDKDYPLVFLLSDNIELRVYKKHVFAGGEQLITASFVNCHKASSNQTDISSKTAFQVCLEVCPDREANTEPSIFAFTERRDGVKTDEEFQELELLYREKQCFAQGHGCSVMWDMEHDQPEWVRTDFLPSYNLKQMKPSIFADDGKLFSMAYLAHSESTEVMPRIREYIKGYRRWIENLSAQATQLPESHQESAARNIEKCFNAFHCIEKTINELEKSCLSDKKAWQAFQFMNKAMFMQRKQTLLRNKKAVAPDGDIRWYPFQLAFILQEMISFIRPNGEERKKVDLLWFPTGGGKTEAYLGIAAFVIFLRRLRNPEEKGVVVIMRYTLRLLTLQQFDRASILIFACELIRHQNRRLLGETEISIGLWVGGKLTPNRLDDAQKELNRIKKGLPPAEANPCQIPVCPWCGTETSKTDNYRIDIDQKRMIVTCLNPDCDVQHFQNGMPLHIIDEAIYDHLPDFIVSTVDKFAQMPMKEEVGRLFGICDKRKKPPELIIQDELHLLSGPLGTMAGLYEMAVTSLCQDRDIPIKIVASTATVKNAANQIKALYGRKYTQFPPQGLTIDDSFFAQIATTKERPARRYLGVMGIGVTPTTTLIRVNAALFFATRYLEVKNFGENVVDNYWTITGYFNSLRELGGAKTQLLDDVQSRYCYLRDTKFAKIFPGRAANDSLDNNLELTSRMENNSIADVIQKLVQPYTANDSRDTYSFLLASNMISVGVDVGRLGAMVVTGQPKTNAEYIQATSRVGREKPGLVVTVYNNFRSRDRSHYEQFLRYHSALYKYVEATSVTPFSDRARDRGLHALFVALCRLQVAGLRHDEAASAFDPENPAIKEIETMILDYVSLIDPSERESTEAELREIIAEWHELGRTQILKYHTYYDPGGRYEDFLLKPDRMDDRFRTMNSMRSVGGQSGIFIKEGR